MNDAAGPISMGSSFRDALACPACYASLMVSKAGRILTCISCSRQYEIMSSIPILGLKDSLWKLKKKQIEMHIRWDQNFPTVDEHIAYRKNAISEITSLISLYLGKGNGSLVLDVGGNTGHASNAFLKTGYRAINFDFVYQYLEMSYEINRRYQEQGKYLAILGDMVTLPFKTNVFDVVLCRDTLHHCMAPKVLIKELFRVCKGGGLVILIDSRKRPCNISDLIAKFHDYRDRKGNDLTAVIHPNTHVDVLSDMSTLGSYGFIFFNKSVLTSDIFNSKRARARAVYASVCRNIPSFLQAFLAGRLPTRTTVIVKKKATVSFEKKVLDYPPLTFKDVYIAESMACLKRALMEQCSTGEYE